jgi:glycosyltransferase involved in cell wall biosynthesis/ADP-heptose:LPS heptosyltransferase
MHILIDLQGAQTGSRHRGIGRYTLAIAKAIVRNGGVHRITVLLNDSFGDTAGQLRRELSGLLPEDEFVSFSIPRPVEGLIPDNDFRREAAELLREWAIARISPDVVLVTSLFEGALDDGVTSIGRLDSGVPTVSILYDLIPLVDSAPMVADQERYQHQKAWYYGKIESLKRSTMLLAISDSARREALELVNFPPERVHSIYSAADPRFARKHLDGIERKEFEQRIGLKHKFVMHTSAFEPRKNFEGLIKAFGQLPEAMRADYQLVLVTSLAPEHQAKLRKLAVQSGMGVQQLVLAGHVNDRELIHLYSSCDLFVFPSFHEGFGLPAVEAMSCGALVIGSNASSVPEVIGWEEALFDPKDVPAIARLMERALTDDTFRNALKEHCARQATVFSWDRTAKLAIQAIETIGMRPRGTGALSDARTAIMEILATPAFSSVTGQDLVEVAGSLAQIEKATDRWLSIDLGEADAGIDDDDPAAAAGPVDDPVAPSGPVHVNALRSTPLPPSPSLKILLLMLSQASDFTASEEAFRIIRRTWPEAQITLVCEPGSREFAERAGLFDKVLSCAFFAESGAGGSEQAPQAHGVEAYDALGLGIFDFALDMRYFGDTRVLLQRTRSRLRAGYGGTDVELDLSLPVAPDARTMLHAGAQAVALASAAAWTFGPRSSTTRDLLLDGRVPVREFKSGLVVGIAPGTGNPIKSWGRSNFAEFMEQMSIHRDCRFVLIGSPRDRDDASFIAGHVGADKCVNLAGTLAIDDVGPVLAGLDLFVGNDTGTTHMAGALGVPTICLFSGQSHVRSWMAMGDNVVTLKADVPCSPCYLVQVEKCTQQHRCMDIAPGRVVSEALGLLDSLRPSIQSKEAVDVSARASG